MNDHIANLAAEILLDLKCISFSPKKKFKLTSGKESPVYCDCRRIISFPGERKKLIELGIDKLKKKINFEKISNVSGGETAGIPFASLLADYSNLPMTYIRKEKKKFGRNAQIEGIINKEDNVLLVEDLMTDGRSKINFLEAIDSTGAKIIGIFVIFNYGILNDFYTFKDKKVDIICLTSWKFVLNVALKKKILNQNEVISIQKFLSEMSIKS